MRYFSSIRVFENFLIIHGFVKRSLVKQNTNFLLILQLFWKFMNFHFLWTTCISYDSWRHFKFIFPTKIQLHYIFFGKNWIFKIFHFNFGKKKKFKRNFFEVIFSLTPNAPFTVFSYTKKENYKKVWHSWDQPIQNGKCLKHGRGWFNPCPAF